jgi:hypothetical protein
VQFGWLWLDRPVLRWRSSRRLRALGLARRFRLEDLGQRLGKQLGRPVFFVTASLPPSAPSGVVLRTDEGLLVVADACTTPMHRVHIWLHEIAHILLGHVGPEANDASRQLRRLFPSLPPDVLAHVLTRTSCADRKEEVDAETLAAVALQQISSWRRVEQPTDVPPALAETLRRFQDTLG